MKRQWLVVALLFGLGLSMVSGTQAVSEPSDAARISRLISELASTKFSERRQATRELDAIGAPALDALRKAMSHADMEICHRARELVAAIEKRLDTAAVLAPTRVRLVCKDMPVPDAIAELSKLAKIEILIEPASKPKLAQRKVTLDTGEVTFWEALDMLCRKAGLVETTVQHTPMATGYSYPIIIAPPQRIVVPQAVKPVIMPAKPAIKLVPKKPIGAQAQPQKPKAQPEKPKEPQPKNKEVQAQPQQAKAAKANQAQLRKQKAAEAAQRAARRFVIQQVQVQAQPAQVQFQQAQIQVALLTDIDVVNMHGPDLSRIVLADGKPEVVPTCYAGAFRIRARTGAGKDKDSAGITFEVTAEPRQLGWNIVGKPRLEKARDARGQLVTVILEQPPNQVAMNQWAGNIRMAQMEVAYFTGQGRSPPLKRTVQIQIKLGEKPGKLLADMTGQITVEAKTSPQDLIVVDNILTAGGKTSKGARGGSIEVVQVIKDKNGNYQISFKIDKGPGDQGACALVDGKGVSFPLLGRSLANTNGAYVETLTFQPQKGRAPAKLVFSAPLNVNVDVPFSFKGLKLP